MKGEPAIYCDYCGWVDNPSRHLGTCPAAETVPEQPSSRTEVNRVASCDWPAHRDEPRCERAALLAEIERLRVALDEAQLRSIEARNPGIDMEEVRRVRGS